MTQRTGTNFTDRKDIRDYVNAGETNAQVIAQNLNLQVEPVQNYIDVLTAPEPAPEEEDKPKRARSRAKPAPVEPEAPTPQVEDED